MKVAKRFINIILSLITTFLLMAAPVAAIVYASEPIEENNEYVVDSYHISQDNKVIAKLDLIGAKINDLKPDILDESIASIVRGLHQ